MIDRTKEDIEMISVALDEYMICKGRNVMSMESKLVWMKRLVSRETKVVLWSIERAIGKEGWPEISTLYETCKEYFVVHAVEIEEKAREERRKKLLEYEAANPAPLLKGPFDLAALQKRLREN